ncbi:DNA polymerase III subunit delta [Steroidobacter denitrificans]|uniref:DNA polymerase III subunit delta n=1 Tax=Steroidobacter denitrificans TaxID=465721 RepID=A0A127FAL0_STEDE|nr:DNA polymerase III subunit delta [Steroidobacter denitrificans]AMN46638.1 DNA polymerase III subunit delta [Steroidobacter denitrificans]
MKISGDKLAGELARKLAGIYLVSGDEPLLVDEAADAIRARARAEGYAERDLHVIERGFDWQALLADSRALSLFAQRKIIEIRMANPAPGEPGAAAIVDLAGQAAAGTDNLVLIITGKMDGRTQNARWVSAVDKQGVLVQIWPLERTRLPAWIRDRLVRHGLKADADAAALMAERVEGNLLAAHQEVEKLALLLPPGPVSAQTVLEAVADNARFDVLQLGDSAMRGQAARALRILEGLRGEGFEPTLVLWALNKDLQWLVRAQYLMRHGQSAEAAMNAVFVWRPRQAAMKHALGRLRPATIRLLLQEAERADRAIKGVLRTDPWVEFERLVARLAGVDLAAAA